MTAGSARCTAPTSSTSTGKPPRCESRASTASLQLRRRFIVLAITALSSGAISCAPSSRPLPGPALPVRTTKDITTADVRARIFIVADDSMLGRQSATRGNFMMTQYLASESARLGLEPGGENGTWFQTLPLVRRSADSASFIRAGGMALGLFTGFAPIRPTLTLRLGARLAVDSAVAIYGGRAGDTVAVISASDAAGRIVVLDAPLDVNSRPSGVYAASATVAVRQFPGAAAIAIAALDYVTPATATSLRGRGVGVINTTADSNPVGLLVSRAAAAQLMRAPLENMRVGQIGSKVQARVGFTDLPAQAPARNVIAILRGSDPRLRNEFVAVGAHNDHLGTATRPVDHDSLRAYNRVMRPEGAQTAAAVPKPEQIARIAVILDSLRQRSPARADSIYNGADDDGSGSVAALEIAESLAAGPRPRRSIVFVWHTAEEAGLLGSAWFTENPTIPRESIVAQLNMDMVGRGSAADVPKGGPRNLQVIGSRRLSTDLGNVVDSVNARSREPYLIDYSFDTPRHPLNRYCRSDHYMYARYGIPITYFSRGYHMDYHQLTDEPQYINYEGLTKVAGFVKNVAVALANRDDRVVVDKARPDLRAPCRQ
ncbi:MAG: M28 family peptidase [Gemmatimonadaceae bacterium]